MRQFRVGLAGLCLLPVPALASGNDCGGDAYTYAEIVPAQRGRGLKGPIMVLPDTLCADLAASPNARIESLNVFIDPRGPAEERAQTGLPTPAAPFRQR